MQKGNYKFEAIGTTWEIDFFEEIEIKKQDELINSIKEIIENFDQNYSRFRRDSLITKISQKIGTYDLPEDAKPLLNFYTDLYKLSNGAFTPCIGQVLTQAGYDNEYSLVQKGELKNPPPWSNFAYIDHKIQIVEPVLLDFGAAGKGYLIDLVAKFFKRNGLHNFCIEAGGDIFYSSNSKKSLKVGLEDPENKDRVLGIFELKKGSLCASAGNRRKWNNFHHIINPLTLTSPSKILATWVHAKETMLADGLATALFLTDPKTLLCKYNFDYLIAHSDYSIEKTAGFKVKFFK